jgi:hypothetical protein
MVTVFFTFVTIGLFAAIAINVLESVSGAHTVTPA